MIWKPVSLSWTKPPPQSSPTLILVKEMHKLLWHQDAFFLLSFFIDSLQQAMLIFPRDALANRFDLSYTLHLRLILNSRRVIGHRKCCHPFWNHILSTVAFSKIYFLLIKCLSNNSKKALPNHWLSSVIPATQKWHAPIEQSFACLRNLKKTWPWLVCPGFNPSFDQVKSIMLRVVCQSKGYFLEVKPDTVIAI